MHTPLSAHHLAEVLPGSWVVKATNMKMWLDGRRRDPILRYSIAQTAPLVFNESVEFVQADGKPSTVTGKSREIAGEFVWHGSGILRVVAGRWQATGSCHGGDAIVIRYRRTPLVPSGLSVLVREGAVVEELRAEVAHHAHDLGLGLEDFATLNWHLEQV
ncbi:hypothetical protein FB562_0879 [Homoserinimonas aerilata]|uniref:Uncharacterized protein n=1 Tax=Homoserinimonas aerilata TaxID=1162970 RepID=A0A542YIA6_9MICO|nr:hypothetical protein [Homoserinimonas aerilata]TQL47808.1 hypothetical protein FB562_0879 [Homoserinimonas aerilata]